ncbi:hypothetical protein I5G87_gp54 [Mycobacterium phage Ekdilam]|uniref:Uncharacterized protein n=1 Tax=Mycobacterium phage Ekdilam TaxID=2599862 RepID=A0A5J6TM59_9CAUD|nr:hypothetical protein I5G87_gp54 [Mycobacterium phage Ekdilam]QFG11478.1 hypothetical protein PBI_EKDILAM_54 [Mycobacterium phage Ekdilam]
MTDSKRPWWADREVVETWVEQRQFEATLAYLDGLAVAVEHRIAYGVDDSAAAAKHALDRLDAQHDGDRLLIGRMPLDDSIEIVLSLGVDGTNCRMAKVERTEPEPLPFQRDDPAHFMVCACSHVYTDHSDVGCSHCPECCRFRYSHDDDERVSNA